MTGYKEYLGDAVYADFDGYGIVLTTEDGYRSTNRIVLDPEIIDVLNRYVRVLREKLDREASGPRDGVKERD